MTEVASPLDPAALDGVEAFERILSRLESGKGGAAGGLWGSSQALVLAGLARRAQGPWMVILSSDNEARAFADDLELCGVDPAWFPSRQSGGRAGAHADAELTRRRLAVARALAGPREERPRLVVASLIALLQTVPAAREIEAEMISLATGETLAAEPLLQRLIKRGFQRVPLVERPGEVSLRGDILDLYPWASELPLRVELFDDEIESLRTFEPADQRSLQTHDSIELCLAREELEATGEGTSAFDLTSQAAIVVEIEPLRIDDAAGGLRVQSGEYAKALYHHTEALDLRRRVKLQSLPADGVNFDTRSVQALSVGIREAPEALRSATAGGERAVVLCQNEGEQHRFAELIEEAGGVPSVTVAIGSCTKGFRLPALKLVVLNHRELIGIMGSRQSIKERPAHRARVIQSFFELKIGDHVVHAVHGLARFEGLKRMKRGEGEEEHLHLVFAEDVSLFVPASKVDVVQRYIGSGASNVPLDKIGSQSFRKRREKVQRALFDLASDLLEVHAKRALKKGRAWPEDDELVREMIAEFPYTETPDQLTTDVEIHDDLSAPRPMDRLVCGDVGFGKTELAVRAAFRVVNGGAQVAMLVPTTVLAQQHEESFRERLADFPVRIEALSRYTTGKAAKEALEAVAAGEVDIVIGTHRILSKDVRFGNLGLVIIDEEQRFGVKHKEHFKHLRAEVDLLTLSATPIPRTLHMSLSGVRDISALAMPPPGRQEIETLLGYVEDTDLIREAILREKNRGGQLFYLHNRVQSIERVARELQQLVPECTYAIGHGQMGARALQKVMKAFARGEVDVLLATTIIESGLDIPAAGTIIVHDADHFGLSELHQLRGRVGRGRNKAYCYLLVEQHKPLRDIARERLKALEEMNQLGAGFAISMKDLEIRGAGNVLGPEQSGHISAVGYDLYCRLLKQVIQRMQAGESIEDIQTHEKSLGGVELELGLPAYLPSEWIPDPEARLELIRKLSTVRLAEEVAEAEAELRDRFGRIPDAARNLVRSFHLGARLEEIGISRLAWQDDVYLIAFQDRVALESWLAPHRLELRPIRTGMAHLVRPRKIRTPAQGLEWIESLLKQHDDATRMPETSAPSSARRP